MGYSIGEIGSRLGIATSAIRYYEKAGLIPRAGRRSGRRVYDHDELDIIAFVARARSAGLAIRDIRRLASLFRTVEPGGDQCVDARAFASEKIAELDRQIADAQALRRQLVEATDADCGQGDRCAVISR